jgi:uncharacterized protein DUF6448
VSMRQLTRSLQSVILVVAMSVAWPVHALAHCDGLDGPVVKAARAALDEHNLALVLVWVQPNDEPEIRDAFERTLAVRSLSPQAEELADRFFFETVVRVHRAGEGAPYAGLKPSGRDLGPAIPAADRALTERSLEPLEQLLTNTMLGRLRGHFHDAATTSAYDVGDLAAGREHVRAYVEFIHYVERLYETATAGARGHFDESGGTVRERR